MTILSQFEVEAYCRGTAKRANLEIRWNDKGEASTNGKTVWLPRITSLTTQDEAEDIMGLVAHETAHVLYSDFEVLKKHNVRVRDSLLGVITNLLEDDNVNAINAAEYVGDRQIRASSTKRALGRIIKKLQDCPKLDKTQQEIATLLAWDCDVSSDYYTGIAHYEDDLAALLDADYAAKLSKLRDGPYRNVLKNLRTHTGKDRSELVYQLARKIYEEVFEEDADKEEQRCKELNDKEKAAGEGDEAEAAGTGAGEDDKDAEETDGEGKKSKKRATKSTIRTYEPYLIDNHSEFLTVDPLSAPSQKLVYDDYDKKKDSYYAYAPTPFADTIVVDYVSGKSTNTSIRPAETDVGGRHRTQNVDMAAAKDTSGFANRVRMLLQIRSRSKTQYGVKRGALHPANTYRVVLKNAAGYNERIFKRTIHSDTLDTAVYVLGDISGSMGGAKMEHEIIAMCKINDAIGNALRIPLELAGFTELRAKNAMFIWRKFTTQTLPNERLAKRMLHASSHMNQNADGDSVLYAYYQLKQRKEKRKVLIVLSDGTPSCDKAGDIYGYTVDVVKKIEQDKTVDVYAIGIMDDNVKRIYTQNKVIKSADELETALLQIIERKII